MKIKRIVAITLSIILMLCIGIMPFCHTMAESDVKATILFTNDIRGFASDLTYVASYKEQTENCALINCANFSKGAAQASLSNSKIALRLMDEAGYDVISIGNDDFSYGNRAMRRYADYTSASLLSGNVTYNNAEIFNKNTILNIGGVKIGFFSLLDKKTADYLPTARADGYDFANEIEFATEQVNYLKSKCDKVVCLSSFSYNKNGIKPEDIAQNVSGIDVIICSNLAESVNKTVGSTLIINAKERLGELGKIEILSDGSIDFKSLPGENSGDKESVKNTFREYGESPTFNTAYEKEMEEFSKNVSDTIALNKTTIYGLLDDNDISLYEETPLGDVFADAMTLAGEKLKALNTQFKNDYVVAAINGTAIKNNISSGKITLLDSFNSAEFAENLYYYNVNTDFLFSLMEKSVSEIKYNSKTDFVYNPSDKFLQISGFNVVVNPKNKAGSRIEKMFIKVDDEKEIELKKGDKNTFLLAVNEMLAVGREGYDDFEDLKPVYIGDFLTNYIKTVIASNVSEDYYISPGTDGRIAFKRISELQPNGDAWFTLNRKYETNIAAEVLVDGIDNMDCSQVDEKGEVRITAKTGGHGISVNGLDMYVSSVSGIGIKKGTLTPIVDYKLYYKTLDDAYKIDEDAYASEAVDGYFAYLSRAYVQTKLTEEGEVVKATQDIFDLKDDFIENPDSFIEKEDEEEMIEDEYKYPSLDDFAYKGTFSSDVFVNTPNTSSAKRLNTSNSQNNSVNKAKNSSTGDNVYIVLIVSAIAFTLAFALLLFYFIKKYKKEVKQWVHKK